MKIGYFLIYSVLYFMIDNLNRSIGEFYAEFGLLMTILNIALTLTMAALSAYLLSLSHEIFKKSGFKSKGENFSYISVLFGILTYGCTPCVIAFFANIGISFSVMILPFGGLPYKIVALVLIVFGIYWSRRDIKCKIGGVVS